MAKQFWIMKNNLQTGPYDSGQILAMAKAGIIAQNDLISQDRVRWREARNVKGLFASGMPEQSMFMPPEFATGVPSQFPVADDSPGLAQLISRNSEYIILVAGILALLFCLLPIVGIPVSTISLIYLAVIAIKRKKGERLKRVPLYIGGAAAILGWVVALAAMTSPGKPVTYRVQTANNEGSVRYLRSLMDALTSAPGVGTPSGRSTSELREYCRRKANLFSDIAAKISAIPTDGADPELINCGQKFLACFKRGKQLAEEYVELISSIESSNNYYSSSDAMAEALLRGMQGDPFGTARDMTNEQSRLMQKGQEISVRWDQFKSDFNAASNTLKEVSARLSLH